MSDLLDFAKFMSTPTESNRYRLARGILSAELVKTGGELFAHLISQKQLEDMKKIDPKKAAAEEMMHTLFGAGAPLNASLIGYWDKYVALGQVMQELMELEVKEDERRKEANPE